MSHEAAEQKLGHCNQYYEMSSHFRPFGHIYIINSRNICVRNLKSYFHIHLYTMNMHMNNVDNIQSALLLAAILVVFWSHLCQWLLKYLCQKLKILHSHASMYYAYQCQWYKPYPMYSNMVAIFVLFWHIHVINLWNTFRNFTFYMYVHMCTVDVHINNFYSIPSILHEVVIFVCSLFCMLEMLVYAHVPVCTIHMHCYMCYISNMSICKNIHLIVYIYANRCI